MADRNLPAYLDDIAENGIPLLLVETRFSKRGTVTEKPATVSLTPRDQFRAPSQSFIIKYERRVIVPSLSYQLGFETTRKRTGARCRTGG